VELKYIQFLVCQPGFWLPGCIPNHLNQNFCPGFQNGVKKQKLLALAIKVFCPIESCFAING
jgi:hypothetical protein